MGLRFLWSLVLVRGLRRQFGVRIPPLERHPALSLLLLILLLLLLLFLLLFFLRFLLLLFLRFLRLFLRLLLRLLLHLFLHPLVFVFRLVLLLLFLLFLLLLLLLLLRFLLFLRFYLLVLLLVLLLPKLREEASDDISKGVSLRFLRLFLADGMSEVERMWVGLGWGVTTHLSRLSLRDFFDLRRLGVLCYFGHGISCVEGEGGRVTLWQGCSKPSAFNNVGAFFQSGSRVRTWSGWQGCHACDGWREVLR